jgi:hypothetical protein
MTLINILFLPVIFFIGLVTSYEDIKYGKIRNKWIIFGISWGLGVLLLLFLWDSVAPSLMSSRSLPIFTVHFSYFLKVLVNTAIAVAVSFTMWRFHVWTAGDAKLFIIYSLLVPLPYYWKTNLLFFPSFALLANIFFIVFMYFLFCSSFFYVKSVLTGKMAREISQDDKEKKFHFKNFLKTNLGMILGLLAIILSFNLFHQVIQKYVFFDVTPLQVAIFMAFAIFSKVINKFFQKPIILKIIISFLIFLMSYGFINNFPAAIKTMGWALGMMIIFMAIFGFSQKLINVYLEKMQPIKSISFAVWMFMGVMVTLIMKGSLPTLLLQYIFGG